MKIRSQATPRPSTFEFRISFVIRHCHFCFVGAVELVFAMTADQIIGLSLALFVMCIGLAGSVLPGLPSTPLVLLVAIAHRLWFGAAGASNLALVILGGLTVLSLV